MFGECEAGTRPCVFCNINYSRRPAAACWAGRHSERGTYHPLTSKLQEWRQEGEKLNGWSWERLKERGRGHLAWRGRSGKSRDKERAGNQHNCCWPLPCHWLNRHPRHTYCVDAACMEMNRLRWHLWEAGIITSFVPGNFIPVHTLNFFPRTRLPTVVRLLPIPEFSVCPPSCCLLCDASKGLVWDYTRAPHPHRAPGLFQEVAPPVCCTN